MNDPNQIRKLKAYESFNSLTLNELDCLGEKYQELEYQQDESICKQGSFAKQVMFLLKGKVKLFTENTDLTNILTLEVNGTFLGLPILFSSGVFPYSIVAFENSIVGFFDLEDFQEVVRENGWFASEVIRQMNDYTLRSFDRLHCLTHKQMHGRLADILICLKERIYFADSFFTTLSRKELAELTAMSAESLSRIIKDLNDEGIVKIEGRSIQILDFKRLQFISETG